MDAQSYDQLTDAKLFALCVWREARGEQYLAKRGVAHVIWNRAQRPGWWGHDLRSVILKPYQFSSFNESDPNSKEWPPIFGSDFDAWVDSEAIANAVMSRDTSEQNDVTNGAVYYYSRPLTKPPAAWGPVETTVVIGGLTFCKETKVPTLDTEE